MSVNSKMTAIADEIRSLLGVSGSLGLDAMATQLNSANTVASNQTDLITQIIGALEGKAAGGGSSGGGIGFSMGRFTPSSTITGKYTVQHDLGVVPDIVVLYDTGRYVTTKWAAYISVFTKVSYGDAYPVHTVQQYGTGQSSFYADGDDEGFQENTSSSCAYATENDITFNGANNGYLVSGRTYSWFAISGVI